MGTTAPWNRALRAANERLGDGLKLSPNCRVDIKKEARISPKPLF